MTQTLISQLLSSSIHKRNARGHPLPVVCVCLPEESDELLLFHRDAAPEEHPDLPRQKECNFAWQPDQCKSLWYKRIPSVYCQRLAVQLDS